MKYITKFYLNLKTTEDEIEEIKNALVPYSFERDGMTFVSNIPKTKRRKFIKRFPRIQSFNVLKKGGKNENNA